MSRCVASLKGFARVAGELGRRVVNKRRRLPCFGGQRQGDCCASVVFNYNIVQLRANYGARAERNWRRRVVGMLMVMAYALWTFELYLTHA